MARSNFTNPTLKLARAIGRDVNAQNHIALGAQSGATAPSAPLQSITTRAGDGSEANPYRTRHAMFWGLDNWGECDWADAGEVL
jgi:hypothetical protein